MATRDVVGDVIALTHTFAGGTPDTVTVTVTAPDGTSSSPSTTSAGAGVFTAEFTTTTAGLHQVKWVGTGTVEETADEQFRVFTAADTTMYAGLDELKAALTITGTGDDESLSQALEAACRAIDEWCGRRFWRGAAGEVRWATASRDGAEVPLPDCIAVTAVSLDGGAGTFTGTATVGTHCYLHPRAAATDNAPYTQLKALGGYRFPTGTEWVKVTGTFGWPAVPAAVSQAAIMQATRIWKRTREAPFGIAALTLDGGGMRLLARIDSEVEVLLRPYRRAMVG